MEDIEEVVRRWTVSNLVCSAMVVEHIRVESLIPQGIFTGEEEQVLCVSLPVALQETVLTPG